MIIETSKQRHLFETADKKRIVEYYGDKDENIKSVICEDSETGVSVIDGYDCDRGTGKSERFFENLESAKKYLTENKSVIEYTQEVTKMKEQLKEELSASEIRSAIGKHFDYSVSFELVDIIENVINRIDDIYIEDEDELYDAIQDAIDDALIYTEDQWNIMKQYQSPQDANWSDAVDEFFNDVSAIVYDLREERSEETVADEEEEESLKEEKSTNVCSFAIALDDRSNVDNETIKSKLNELNVDYRKFKDEYFVFNATDAQRDEIESIGAYIID